MGLVKVLLFLVKTKIIHFGEIYRLISFHYYFTKQKIDISGLRVLDIGFNKGVYRWYFTEFLGCSHYSGIEIDRMFLGIYPETFYHNFEKNKLHKISSKIEKLKAKILKSNSEKKISKTKKVTSNAVIDRNDWFIPKLRQSSNHLSKASSRRSCFLLMARSRCWDSQIETRAA